MLLPLVSIVSKRLRNPLPHSERARRLVYCQDSRTRPPGRPGGSEIAELRVWPVPGVLAIFRVMSAEEIDFDVDPREPQGQA